MPTDEGQMRCERIGRNTLLCLKAAFGSLDRAVRPLGVERRLQ